MGRTGKNTELPGKDAKKPKTPAPSPPEDDGDEGGDIATPKRDRHGEDDQPL